jgi:serine/threonine protein kinase
MEERVIAGRYRLVRPLGRGGMGAVWLGEDQLAGRQVAVKEIRAPDGAGADDRDVFAKRALQEARSAARLAHPNAVTLHDIIPASAADDAVYLIMEYVEGATLSQLIQQEGPLSEPRTAGIALQLLSILETAHALGIVHRDIKPANIMVNGRGQVKLADFGIAHVVGGTRLTGSGVIGTPAYMAPEQLQGQDITPAVDGWALGVTLYAAVAGRNPFDRQNTAATFHAILMAELPPPACAPPLAPVIAGLLLRDPAQRMTLATARELLGEPAFAAALSPVAAPPALAGPPTRPGTSSPLSSASQPGQARPGGTWHPGTAAARRPERWPAGRRRTVAITVAAVGAAAAIAAAATMLLTRSPGTTAGPGATGGSSTAPPASPAAGLTTDTGPAAASAAGVPQAYLGGWHGTLSDNTGLEGPQAAQLSLTGGAVNSVVGTVTYPAIGCGYDLRLISSAANEVDLYEQVMSGACISEYVVLTPAGAGLTESVYSTPPDGRGQPDFSGMLTKGSVWP